MARPLPALGAAVLLTALASWGASAEPAAAPTPAEALERGTCGACHRVPGAPAVARQDSCADCHAWIRKVASNPGAREKAKQVFPLWERYEHNVGSYLAVPSLEAAMARLDPDWVARYLADPHDLRPGMPETMPRLALSGAELGAIAEGFRAVQTPVPPQPVPSAERVAAGEALFTSRGCVGCHAFGARHTGPGLPSAPDLRWARERMDPDRAVAWIRDPRSVSAAATMPTMGLSEADALALRDYLWLAEPGGTEAAPSVPTLPAVAGTPDWATVEERVIGVICVHCHMDPAQNEGRTGPGNGGGFGYAGSGIELQNPATVCANGPAVVDAMLRRHQEVHRDVVDFGEVPPVVERPVPGMPLGLPAIPVKDIALVQAWLDGGCLVSASPSVPQ